MSSEELGGSSSLTLQQTWPVEQASDTGKKVVRTKWTGKGIRMIQSARGAWSMSCCRSFICIALEDLKVFSTVSPLATELQCLECVCE